MVLGYLLCTEELIPDKAGEPLCGKCQVCIEACPTQAIEQPFVVNADHCLAYHTIENRSSTLPTTITEAMGTWVAGCDICQEVCPWNHQSIESSSDPAMQPKEWILKLKKEEALNWTDKTWEKALQGSALKRIKPWMWRRNIKATQLDKNENKKL